MLEMQVRVALGNTEETIKNGQSRESGKRSLKIRKG